jgi:hypothetical protein
MRYSHFAHIPDPGVFTRKLTCEQAERVVRMKDESGLTWGAIAAWFSRNGTPISYGAVKNAYWRVKEQRQAA